VRLDRRDCLAGSARADHRRWRAPGPLGGATAAGPRP